MVRRERSGGGRSVHSRLVFEPEGEVLGGFVMVHGLGDHAARHQRVLERFADAGIAVVAPDLPGHGQSPGRRGHIAGPDLLDGLLDTSRARLGELVPEGPLGIGGHSMGALLVLDHFGGGGGSEFSWVWLSSALVEPAHGKPAWLRFLGRMVAPVMPSLTIRNGVGLAACYDPSVTGITREQERASGTHNRLSVGLAAELLRSATRLRANAGNLFKDVPVLMTHGDTDRVCPIEYAEALFEALPGAQKEFLTIAGGRHEPWHDPEVAAAVCRWMLGCV